MEEFYVRELQVVVILLRKPTGGIMLGSCNFQEQIHAAKESM
jgi:hypothetical protein